MVTNELKVQKIANKSLNKFDITDQTSEWQRLILGSGGTTLTVFWKLVMPGDFKRKVYKRVNFLWLIFLGTFLSENDQWTSDLKKHINQPSFAIPNKL